MKFEVQVYLEPQFGLAVRVLSHRFLVVMIGPVSIAVGWWRR